MNTASELGFKRSLAYLVGINVYERPIPSLQTPVDDAKALAELLARKHGYTVRCLLRKVTSDELTKLQVRIRAEVGPDDRVLFYFAGHGLAPDDVGAKERRAGYLLPSDARLEDRTKCLAMDDLYQTLDGLECRHMLIILDCCYAGRFRWAKVVSDREFEAVPEDRIYVERYRRFLRQPAWQLLTSAGQNERAADVIFGAREQIANHSPFAAALIDGLSGGADKKRLGEASGDGVIPLYELYQYLEPQVAQMTQGRQTVEYFPLPRHDTGQYVFLVPGVLADQLQLPDALPLLKEHNPYKGLDPYGQTEQDQRLFFGRRTAIAELREKVTSRPLTVVVGTSGSGKSSLVRAGLMAELTQDPAWLVLPVVRPGSKPLDELVRGLGSLLSVGVTAERFHNRQSATALVDVVAEWQRARNGTDQLLLCIDQFEELLTQRVDDDERNHYLLLLREACLDPSLPLHLVLTVRSDYAPIFGNNTGAASPSPLAALWEAASFPVPPLKREELREIVVGPATERALLFDPSNLVEDLVVAVFERPGGLPLLSFALWKLYQLCVERVVRTGQFDDRRLSWDDAKDEKGTSRLEGALRRHADELYNNLANPQREAMQSVLRRLMLRLVDFEGRELVRRRAPRAELLDFDEQERSLTELVLKILEESRLVTSGTMSSPANPMQEEASVEISHEALLHGWNKLQGWASAEQTAAETGGLSVALRRRLTQETLNWSGGSGIRDDKYLWNTSPYLPLAKQQLIFDPLTFNRAETRFIHASERRRQRNQRRRVAIVFATIIGLCLLTVVAFYERDVAKGLADKNGKLAEDNGIKASENQTLAEQNEIKATENQRLAEERGRANKALRSALLRSQVRESLTLMQSDNYLDALPWLSRALSIASDGQDLEEAPHRARLAYALGECPSLLRAIRVRDAKIDRVSFSNTGTYLLVGYTSPDDRQWVSLYLGKTGSLIGSPVQVPTYVERVQFSNNEKYVLIDFVNSGKQQLWETARGKAVPYPGAGKRDTIFASISPGGDTLVSQCNDGEVIVSRLPPTDRPVFSLDKVARLRFADVDASGLRLLIVTEDGTATLHELTSGNVTRKFTIDKTSFDVALTPDGRTCRVLSTGGIVDNYGLTEKDDKQTRLVEFPTKENLLSAPKFSPDRAQAIASYGTLVIGIVDVWDCVSGAKVNPAPMGRRNSSIAQYDVSRPAGFLAAVSTLTTTTTVPIWHISSPGSQPFIELLHPAYASDVSFGILPVVATASYDGLVRIWNFGNSSIFGSTAHLRGEMVRSWVDSGYCLLFVSSKDRLFAIEALSGVKIGEWGGFAGPFDVTVKSGGNSFVYSTKDGPKEVVIGGLLNEKGNMTATSAGLSRGKKHAMEGISPDGRMEFQVDPQMLVINVRNIERGGLLYSVSHEGDEMYGAAWSSDSKKLATYSRKSVQIRDARTGAAIGPRLSNTILIQNAGFKKVEFNARDTLLLTIAEGPLGLPHSQVQLWDALTAEAVTPPIKSEQGVRDAFVGPLGEYLAIVYSGATIGKSEDDRVATYNLSLGRCNVSDAEALTSMLSCRRIDPKTGGVLAIGKEEFGEAWEKWRQVDESSRMRLTVGRSHEPPSSVR
jgi:WD40 repeat protein